MNHKLPEALLLSEVQLLLSEKRTYFSLLRTSIAVFGAPLSVILFLVATSNYHRLFDNNFITIMVIGGLIIISLIGLWLFYYAERKVSYINKLIKKIEAQDKRVADIVI